MDLYILSSLIYNFEVYNNPLKFPEKNAALGLF